MSAAESGGTITVFTKPWPRDPVERLATRLAAMGVSGIELPVRPGYQVSPDRLERLGAAVDAFAAEGLRVASVAVTDETLQSAHRDPKPLEALTAAMGEAGVPILRVMAKVRPDVGYRGTVDGLRWTIESLGAALRDAGVVVGIQNHYDHYVGSAAGIDHILQPLDPEIAGFILDPAHCALAGEPVQLAFDIAAPRLLMVNIKQGLPCRKSLPHADPEWRVVWTTARGGLLSWRQVVEAARDRGFRGDYCLSAEYSSPEKLTLAEAPDLSGEAVFPLLQQDLAELRRFLGNPVIGANRDSGRGNTPD